MPELGTKHECAGCGAKFYDLGSAEPICPKCGLNQLADDSEEATEVEESEEPAAADKAEEPEAEPATDAKGQAEDDAKKK